MSLDSEKINKFADGIVNDPQIEQIWAINAIEHMNVYFNLISSFKGSALKLTPKDDFIYATFKKEFLDFNIKNITEESLKSSDAKKKWREFCIKFENEINDYNMGTMLRLDSSKEYTEENTILVTRIQFYAIEIARNKEGLNDCIYGFKSV